MGVNTIVAGLGTVPKLWDVSRFSEQDVGKFCNLYRDVCVKIGPVEPRVIALQNLTEVLDHVLKSGNISYVSPDLLLEVWSSLPLSSINPALANAVTRISGCIIAILSRAQVVTPAGIKNWGHMMADAGLDDKVSDGEASDIRSLTTKPFYRILILVSLQSNHSAHSSPSLRWANHGFKKNTSQLSSLSMTPSTTTTTIFETWDPQQYRAF
jgi:hypothetical protein